MIGKTILLIDDERSDIEKMRRELEDAGFTVLAAESYQEALDVFQVHSSEIDALVVDVSLPGQNGVELAKALLRRNQDLRVLFVSGHVGAEVIRFYGLPATDRHFLQKPIRPGELAARVAELLQSSEPLHWTKPDEGRPFSDKSKGN